MFEVLSGTSPLACNREIVTNYHMPSVCFYFQVHQPYRAKPYSIFDIGEDHGYFNDESKTNLNNARILQKVANKCYLPTNKLMLELLETHPEFKISYSISGTVLDQFEAFAPEVLESFQRLVKTGRVELLAETYHHSLSFLFSRVIEDAILLLI